jgi:methyl-accepting chemotaxis protein
MQISTKLVIASVLAIAATAAVSLAIQRNNIRKQGIDLAHAAMRSTLLGAENVRDTLSKLNKAQAFDREKLLKDFKASGDLHSSALYKTVPVVAAWESIRTVAKEQGYDFRIPKNQARNKDNLPTAEEADLLRILESGSQDDYFNVDTARNEIVYARPIMLTADCLSCHGDPKNSPTGDGKDVLGFQMENRGSHRPGRHAAHPSLARAAHRRDRTGHLLARSCLVSQAARKSERQPRSRLGRRSDRNRGSGRGG